MHSLHSLTLYSPDPLYWQFVLLPGHSGDRGNRGGGDQHHPRPGEGKGEAGGGDTIENSGSGGESLYPLTVKLWFYFQVSFLNSYSIEYWLISLIDNRPNYYSILTFLIWFLIRLLIRFLHRYLIPFPIRFLIRFLILFLIWFLIRYLIPFPIRFLIRFLPLGLLWFLLWMFPWLEYLNTRT